MPHALRFMPLFRPTAANGSGLSCSTVAVQMQCRASPPVWTVHALPLHPPGISYTMCHVLVNQAASRVQGKHHSLWRILHRDRCLSDNNHHQNITSKPSQTHTISLTTPLAALQTSLWHIVAAMVREKTERDYLREAARPDKRTRELLRRQQEAKGAKGAPGRKGSHKGSKGKRKGELGAKGKGGLNRPPSPTTPPPGHARGERAGPPLTLFSSRASSSEPLRPREPSYPPPAPPASSAGEEEEDVYVEVEAEEAVTAEIPRPVTPPALEEQVSTIQDEETPETPPPPPQSATLAKPEERPRQAIHWKPRLSSEIATASGRKNTSTVQMDSRPHLPPKPKVRSQPPLDSSRDATGEGAAASSSSRETGAGEPPPTGSLCAPTTVRVKGSIGRQLAQRAKSMGLQSAVKSKAKPPKVRKKAAEERTSQVSEPTTVAGDHAKTEDEDGPASSTDNNPAPSGHRTSPLAAPEDTQADLPAPVLICPGEDGTLVELGPLYRRPTPTSDDAAQTTEAEQPTVNTWMVEMDGDLRALPSMPDWIQEALDCRPAQEAPASFTPSRGQRKPAADSHGRVDPDSSTSVEVTRVQWPRSSSKPSPTPSPTAEPAPSSAPANKRTTQSDDTRGAGRCPSESSGRPRDKKKKKKKATKKRQRSRSPSRRKRRRRRPSTPTEDDPTAEAVEVPIRHVSLASTGPPPADPRLVAVQSADSALEPTSPADGERDRSSVSELEYMFCSRCLARLHLPPQKYFSWFLIAWIPLTDILVNSLDCASVCSAHRTAAIGSPGGFPPKAEAPHVPDSAAEHAFLPCRGVASDPRHTPRRSHPTIPTQPALGGRRQWSANISTDQRPTRPCPTTDCLSASLRLKHRPVPPLESSVLGIGPFMEGKPSTDVTEPSTCSKRHPGTPVGVLEEIFRRHVPQPTSRDEHELRPASVEEPATYGAECPPQMLCTPPAVTLPLSPIQHAATIHRQRSGQVPRPSQAPHIRALSSTSRDKARKIISSETTSSNSSTARASGAIQQDDDDAHPHMSNPPGWLPEDDALLDIGGRVEQASETPGVAPQLPVDRLSTACAKMMIRTGLRCSHCFHLKNHCSCKGKRGMPPWPRLNTSTDWMPLLMEDALLQASALPLQWPAAGSQRRVHATCLELMARSSLSLEILSATRQAEVWHPPPWHSQAYHNCSMQVAIRIFSSELTWGSRFHRRRHVLVLNAFRRILWSHAFISLPQVAAQISRSTCLFVRGSLPCRSASLSPDFLAPTAKSLRRSPPTYLESRPGPKSRSGALICALVLQRLQLCTGVSTDVRVAGTVTRPAGASAARSSISPQSIAKHRGADDFRQQAKPIHQTVYAQLSKTGKRSFHRAINRARQHGSTRYKGQRHTLQSLGCTTGPKPSATGNTADEPSAPSTQLRPTPRSRTPPSSDRWRVVSWNAGGLTVAKLYEIETWLDQCHNNGSTVHVCVLTETHWSFHAEWELNSYNVLHSGLSNRKGGILMLIHKTLVPSQAIRSVAPIPGRLLQVRLETNPAIYVVATYQHVWSEQSGLDACLASREEFRSQLASTLRSVPWRAQLLVAGDMNTPCITQYPHVGQGVVQAAESIRQSDQPRLQELLTQFNLIALNTWGRIKHSHTYQFEHTANIHRTQIDFLLYRAQHTDSLAKSARTVQAPFVPVSGMRHLPLRTTLPKPQEPRSKCMRTTASKASEVTSRLQQDPELAQRFQHRVVALIPPTPIGDSAAILNRVMQQAWHEVSRPLPIRPRAPDHAAVGLVRQLWALRRQHRQTPRTFSVLRGWRQAVRLIRVQRQLKKACKAKKRERIETLLHEAEQSRFPSTIFSVVKRLAPKSRTLRVQLRDEHGKLLAGKEESEHIASYLRKIYHSTDIHAAPASTVAQGMHFTQEDLLTALHRLEPSKALPSAFVPARLWKLIPEQVATMLLPYMNLKASGLEVDWHKVQLHLIPKVQQVKDPKNLRPIALLHPGNKLLAFMIAQQVQGKVANYLEQVPQWAYLQGRSTHDALLSVCSHTHQVRELIQAHASTLPQRFRGFQQPRMLGGISISLDVKKAFDSLDHAFLKDSMSDAGFTQPEIDLILHLHSQACLQVGSANSASNVYLGTGVRQGCSLSPLLWALATGRFYRLYLEALQQEHLSEGITNMFADDIFGSWLFRTPAAFKAALRSIGVLVQTLQRVGLQLSQDKTVILLASIGTSSASLLHKIKHFIDKVPHLAIRVGAEQMSFKIATSHTYLGAVISYRNFELSNLKHRLHKTWGSFWRLHHLLISRALSMKTRVRLWRACVFSILRYSLLSVGLPPQGPTMIRQAVNRQLRLIARSPGHIWHTTAAEISHRVQVEDPWLLLCRQHEALATRPKLLYSVSGMDHWLTLLNTTFTYHPSPPKPSLTPDPQSASQHCAASPTLQLIGRDVHAPRRLVCEVCSRTFDSLGALRNHEAHAHKRETAQSNSVQSEESGAGQTGTVQHPGLRTRTSEDALPYMQLRRQVHQPLHEELLLHGLPSHMQTADAQTRFVILHSQQGLSICRHCHRECHSWDDLKVHIFTRACPVLFPNARDPVFPAYDISSIGTYWDDQLAPFLTKGWEAVAAHLKKTEPACYRYCPICRQGLVQARGITLHFRAYHPWASAALQQARQHTTAHRRSLILCSPCRYCGQVFRSHHTKHAAECPMIIYAKTLHNLRTSTAPAGATPSLAATLRWISRESPGTISWKRQQSFSVFRHWPFREQSLQRPHLRPARPSLSWNRPALRCWRFHSHPPLQPRRPRRSEPRRTHPFARPNTHVQGGKVRKAGKARSRHRGLSTTIRIMEGGSVANSSHRVGISHRRHTEAQTVYTCTSGLWNRWWERWRS